MRKTIKILFLLFLAVPAFSQNTNISGVINTYKSVSNIQANTITVASTSGLAANDLLLIIQMQGATINQSNTSSFGDVTNYNSTGNYEYVRICQVLNGSEIETTQIQRSYTTAGKIQLIKVPEYDEATVIGPLTANPWNGTTGGVLVFECINKLTFSSDINLQGLGFRGGALNTSSFSCSWLINNDNYFYDLSTGRGAKKGEGIAAYIIGKTAGRGKQANGGGGGNDHNSGGGGGSNTSIAGIGGERIGDNGFSCSGPNTGIGGATLSYSLNRIFMGGGGGAGHENNANTGTAGLNGGGIVIIRTDTLVGNAYTINVDGETSVANTQDGAGGGGAGGAILLDVNHYSNSINVSATGSNGGNVSNVGSANCNGPGGGGSGGAFLYSNATVPANVSASVNGGSSGTTLSSSQSGCNVGGSNNAQNGNDGIVQGGLTFFEPTNTIHTVQNNITVCTNDSVFYNNAWQTSPGDFYDTTVGFCVDTVTITSLMWHPEIIDTVDLLLCYGESTMINGTVYNSDTIGAKEVFIAGGQNGCDSTVIVNIEILQEANGIDTQESCEPIIWIDGNVYNSSNNTAIYTIQNGSALGCDSIVTLNFIKLAVNTSLTQIGFSLSSNANGATYQWFECEDGFVPIAGEISQTFNPTQNGFYAVEVTENGCTDTSNCIEIVGLAITDLTPFAEVNIYPNPTQSNIVVQLGSLDNATVKVYSIEGKQIYRQENITSGVVLIDLNVSAGIYKVEVGQDNLSKQFKLIVTK